jgi:hypothetical protein
MTQRRRALLENSATTTCRSNQWQPVHPTCCRHIVPPTAPFFGPHGTNACTWPSTRRQPARTDRKALISERSNGKRGNLRPRRHRANFRMDAGNRPRVPAFQPVSHGCPVRSARLHRKGGCPRPRASRNQDIAREAKCGQCRRIVSSLHAQKSACLARRLHSTKSMRMKPNA